MLQVLLVGLLGQACTEGAGGGVRARRLATGGPFMQHEMSASRPGDVLLENEEVRFYITGGAGRDGYVPFAGWVIDAGLARGRGTAPEYDGLDGFYPLVNHAVVGASEVRIVRDGSDGDRAEVVAEGSLVAVEEQLGVSGTRPNPVDVQVELTYSLGPHDRALTIATRVVNPGGVPQTVDIGDVALFGDDEAEPFTVPGGFDRASPLMTLAVLGSAHDQRPYAYAVWPARGELQLFNGSTVAGQVNGDGSLWGYSLGAATLEPGGFIVVERYLSVARDINLALAQRDEPNAAELALVRGQVRAAGVPVTGARVSFFKDAELREFASQTLTDRDGHFEASLPAGEYHAVATGRTLGEHVQQSRVPRELAMGHAPSPVAVLELSSGGAGELDLELGPNARVRIDVCDGEGRPAVAKITFQAEDARPPFYQTGERAPHAPLGVRQLVWTANGEAELDIEPGVYTVTASRGPAADVDVRRGVLVPPGELTRLELVVPRVVELGEYVAIDPHVHGVYSQHGEATAIDRVVTARAEGLDVHVATDHDVIADYRPALGAAGLERELLSIPGVEFATANDDHCAWPLQREEGEWLGGASAWWWDGAGVEEQYQYYRERGAVVIQVAHGTSHFRRAGYDPARGTVSAPELFAWGFNAMEVQNGAGTGGRDTLLPIWYSLLDWGHSVAPLAVSDSHRRSAPVGIARTFVRLASDVPAEVGRLEAGDVARAVAGMHTVASTGPFIELRCGAGGGPGDRCARGADGAVHLDVTIWAPPWMPLTDVWLIAEGVEIQTWNTSTVPAVALDPARAVWFSHEIALDPREDGWYVVAAAGSADLAPVYPGVRPWATTAPIFVDADGDGVVTPRCERVDCSAR